MPYGPKPRPIEDRFREKFAVGTPDECWPWTGAISHGYGYMHGGSERPRFVKAHRLSWELANSRPVPSGRDVLHTCDNPPCVNPGHLYVGTNLENARDRAERKRGKEHRQQGEANDNAKLTEADVRAIIVELQRVPRRSQQAIATQFGVAQQTVSRIMHRRSWSHLWTE
jgi:hypothetical protein